MGVTSYQDIREYLQGCRELNRLCGQDGWIDNDSLRFEVLDESPDARLLVAVSFEEIIMEGAGCVAGRLQRCGRMRLRLDPTGRVESGEVI